ncbi:hypothetical protein [Sinorhizobium fredii]|nr:hypothetical protein [Sinorhizobium fredii]
MDKGGHFAAWEEPALFSTELRAAFQPLRRPPLRRTTHQSVNTATTAF